MTIVLSVLCRCSCHCVRFFVARLVGTGRLFGCKPPAQRAGDRNSRTHHVCACACAVRCVMWFVIMFVVGTSLNVLKKLVWKIPTLHLLGINGFKYLWWNALVLGNFGLQICFSRLQVDLRLQIIALRSIKWFTTFEIVQYLPKCKMLIISG